MIEVRCREDWNLNFITLIMTALCVDGEDL